MIDILHRRNVVQAQANADVDLVLGKTLDCEGAREQLQFIDVPALFAQRPQAVCCDPLAVRAPALCAGIRLDGKRPPQVCNLEALERAVIEGCWEDGLD